MSEQRNNSVKNVLNKDTHETRQGHDAIDKEDFSPEDAAATFQN